MLLDKFFRNALGKRDKCIYSSSSLSLPPIAVVDTWMTWVCEGKYPL